MSPLILIHRMNTELPAGIDLNLLCQCAAVYRLRSVSRAAESLGISQPAASNGLAAAPTPSPALDDCMPNGTCIDMCRRLPLLDPHRISVPTARLRGQFDGIAAMADLIDFFVRLPSPDKLFSVMNGILHASFQQKKCQILHAWFSQPAPVYTAASGH